VQNVVQLQTTARERAFIGGQQADTQATPDLPWEVERDVIRGRTFDRSGKFMPDGLTQVSRLDFLQPHERTLVSQIQGRTYANTFRLFERSIGANMLELSRSHLLGDQEALDSLVRCTQDELKHQALFSRIDQMMAGAMPQGYRFAARPNDFAWMVLGRSRWSVLALTHMLELVTQSHYEESIGPEPTLAQLYKDVLEFHWRDEERHAAVTEREWRAEDARLSAKERDRAVDEFLEVLRAINMMLQRQATADAQYFLRMIKRSLSPLDAGRVEAVFIHAYRWQFVLSGVQHEGFADLLAELISEEQGVRIAAGLLPLAASPQPRELKARGSAAADPRELKARGPAREEA